jgi:hypothetical protein
VDQRPPHFEPSTAHRKALHKGFSVAWVGDGPLVVARIDAQAGRDSLARTPFHERGHGSQRGTILETVVSGSARLLADELDADLVVIGSRHMSGIKRFLLGSTSRALIGETSRPVLVISEVALEPAAYALDWTVTEMCRQLRLISSSPCWHRRRCRRGSVLG